MYYEEGLGLFLTSGNVSLLSLSTVNGDLFSLLPGNGQFSDPWDWHFIIFVNWEYILIMFVI